MTLTAEDLLAGGNLTHEVTIPPALLGSKALPEESARVVLRPLTVRDLQRIGKDAHEDDGLSAALMIQQALVEPALQAEQVAQLPAGLARFLVEQINDISGVSTPRDVLEELVLVPLTRACFILAQEFGWTAEQVSGMTIGQIVLYLQMVRGGKENP